MDKRKLVEQMSVYFGLKNARRPEVVDIQLNNEQMNREEITSKETEDDLGNLFGATVLYVEPGKQLSLISEWEAAEQLPWMENVLSINVYQISETLCICYSPDLAKEIGTKILLLGPFFFASYDEEEDEVIELTAKDYIAARTYIKQHETIVIGQCGMIFHAVALER